MLNMVPKSAIRADFTDELPSTWFLPLECVEAEERGEVTSNGSKHDACLGMALRSGQLGGMGVWKESLGTWAMDGVWKTWNSQGRISKLILEATRNSGVLEAGWKETMELAILLVERDQLGTGPGVFQLCSTEAPRL